MLTPRAALALLVFAVTLAPPRSPAADAASPPGPVALPAVLRADPCEYARGDVVITVDRGPETVLITRQERAPFWPHRMRVVQTLTIPTAIWDQIE